MTKGRPGAGLAPWRVVVLMTVAVLGGAIGRAQTPETPFTELLNGRNLDGWVVENSDGKNFSVTDGVLRVEGPQGWLRSAEQYGNFTLRAAFRFLTDTADSGLFLRAPGPASNIFIRGWPANAYQVQIRNMATNETDNPLWIGHLYRHRVAPGETSYDRAAARQAFRKTGEWQTVDITVDGDTLAVVLNGVPTTRAAGIVNPRGYIGIQGETGAVEYRSISIRVRP
jgi:hypothetical protein